MQLWKGGLLDRFSGEYCCRNDQGLTWETNTTVLGGLFGYEQETIQGWCPGGMTALPEEEYRESMLQQLKEQLAVSDQIELVFPVRHKNGHLVWVLNRGCRVKDDLNQEYLVGILVDITYSKHHYDIEKQKTRQLQERAERDSLTQIYNARTARKMAESYLEETRKGCALLIIDVDDFKQINDQYGHMFGDVVLVQVAQAIQNMFRTQDIVGRIGGEEFMILMKDVSDREIVEERCRQLNEAFHEIMCKQLGDRMLTCSIGVSLALEAEHSYIQLFCGADRALYQAKDRGKDRYVFYESDTVDTGTGRYAHHLLDYDMSVYTI